MERPEGDGRNEGCEAVGQRQKSGDEVSTRSYNLATATDRYVLHLCALPLPI